MFKDVLLAVDLNAPETQQKALDAALAQVGLSGGNLHIVTVVPDFGVGVVAPFFPENFEENLIKSTHQHLHEYVKTQVPKGVPGQRMVAQGTIYREIIRCAIKVKADLIVMASHRPELKDYLLGPNAQQVVKHADCSVLVVRD